MSAATDAPGRGGAPALPAALRRALLRAQRGTARTGAAAARLGRGVLELASPVVLSVGRALGPRLAVLSPTAWALVVLSLGTGITGFVLGWQELIYVGLTLIVALVACAVFLVGRTTYRVGIELSPPRVVVGERALGRLLITNAGERRLLPARMELPVGAGRAEFAVPGLAAGDEHEELFAVPTLRRAVIVAGPAVSVRGDQLGLLRRVMRWTDPIDLFVHPVTIPLAPSAAGLVRDLEGQPTSTITSNDLSFHALREYEPGDDRRNVHWRSTARLGKLMVRQFQETRRSQLTMLVSEFSEHYASAEEFELAISMAASLAGQVIRDGTGLAVVSDRRRLRTHTPSAMLDDSCRFELHPARGMSARDFAREATRRLPPPSVLMLIAGSRLTGSDIRTIDAMFPSDTTTVAFRAKETGDASLASIAGVRVATIGQLRDLPKVVARVSS